MDPGDIPFLSSHFQWLHLHFSNIFHGYIPFFIGELPTFGEHRCRTPSHRFGIREARWPRCATRSGRNVDRISQRFDGEISRNLGEWTWWIRWISMVHSVHSTFFYFLFFLIGGYQHIYICIQYTWWILRFSIGWVGLCKPNLHRGF